MTTAQQTRVIGYVRLSHATEESTSIARQREIIEDYAAKHDLALIDIAEDPDLSASKKRLDRPGLTEVRQAIASGAADAVLVWRLDRLGRNVGDMSTLLDDGVVPISATEPIDGSTTAGRAMIEVLQVFAGMEYRATSERTTSSVNYLRRNRRFAGGPVPYGYQTAPMPVEAGQPPKKGRILVVNPDEAKIVREVADHVLSGGSLYSICQALNKRGEPTRYGKQWAIQTLRGILLAPVTLGRMVIKGDVLRDDQGAPVTVWAPLLPLGDVERLRAILASPRAPRVQRRRATRLLSGMLTCSSCGGTLHVKTNGSNTLAYACVARSMGYRCEKPVSVSADRVEESIEAAYLATIGDQPMVRVIETVPDVAGRAEVEEALRETAMAMTAPDADIPALTARLTDLRAERETIAAVAPSRTTTVVETGQSWADVWADVKDDVAERRRMLADSLEAIIVKPGRRGATTFDPSRLTPVFRDLGVVA